ncbi:DNA polymerase IV [Bifidobacterium actinocoloniiforme DSM 22766]|uniref:DNA polymerase IV n=1 Tax=Bifidobacterium actinocoloniiforme DSM 22766 TaxID=1437605 RepID=A0A086YYN8_9BIFI|nr:DNA polymerase IV [Bifidobacterium actinocoloniiforme]AKV55910.1 DNA polymerase IV [Bifidobacterium actinocoloniiforme DSM 22766]KFI39388.1 DNA polymerase IV [Bifidobacterium actinocoloniiforme DSM 22766]
MSTAPRLAAAKRDWGGDETGCTVLHIDMDAFYASCEVARHPEFKGLPLIVGTGPRSVVSAASYEARPYGINSAMPVARARHLCPNGIFLPVDMSYYRAVSRSIFSQVFARVTDQVEQVSVDECYMDVSAALRRWGRPTNIARWIRQRVAALFHVTCSVGVASNKLIAKMASTNAKPDGMLLIPRARQAEFIQLMPLRAIPGIGQALEKRLKDWGIEDVAALSRSSEAELVQATGSRISAHTLALASQGMDKRVVTPYTPEKSIGAERTFLEDTASLKAVSDLLRQCSDEVASSLRKRGLLARTITVKLRFDDLKYMTKSHTSRVPLHAASAIHPEAMRLLQTMLNMTEEQVASGELPRLIRLAGVSASSLSKAEETPVQPSLDEVLQEEEGETESLRRAQLATAERALDSIRGRYGQGAVKFGL